MQVEERGVDVANDADTQMRLARLLGGLGAIVGAPLLAVALTGERGKLKSAASNEQGAEDVLWRRWATRGASIS